MAPNPTEPDTDDQPAASAAGAPESTGAPEASGAPEPPEPPLLPDPPFPPHPSAGSASGGDRAAGNDTGFFGWLRGLGVRRAPGWIGGVAAGVADRLGIDPLIVRGVLVVFALFGAPAFLAYGAAWLLLPDTSGRIHLERMLRGTFDSALVGIAIFLVIGLFPPAFGVPWLFGDGWPWAWTPWNDGPWFNPLPVVWTLLVLGGIATGIYWLVRLARSSGGADAAAPGSTGAPVGSDSSAPASPAADATTFADASSPVAPAPPRPAAAAAGSDEYLAWKQQHDAWRASHAEWRRAQADSMRQAKSELAERNRVQAAAFAAQADEARRIRRLSRPRTSFAFVVATLGAALVAGALAGIGALNDADAADWAGPIALAASALVTSSAMVLAGALRRRSGFLAFVTVSLLVFAAAASLVPRSSEIAFGATGGPLRATTIVQPVGDVRIYLDARVSDRAGTPQMQVLQGAGVIRIEISDGTRLALDVQCGSCSISLVRAEDSRPLTYDGAQLTSGPTSAATWHREIGPGLEAGRADAALRISTGASRIEVVEFVDDGTLED